MKEQHISHIQKQILQAIAEYDDILIFRHVRPDLDAIGSQIGLARMIEATYPDKKVYTHGKDVPWLSELIAPMNPLPSKDFTGKLVIVLDTANTDRLDGNIENINTAACVIKIDHHLPVEAYGQVQWVEPDASSASELIAKLWWNHSHELKMTTEAAYALYAGIVGDTNRFLYDSTGPETMQLAGELMRYPFDHAALHFKLAEITPVERRLIAYTLENAHVSEVGVGMILFTSETLAELQATDEDTSVTLSLVGNIQGVISWGVFVQQSTGSYRCRLRSKGPAINEIAARHEGGGHKLASGANAHDEMEIKEIVKELEDAVLQFKNK
ncbi:DHH family phosphoesterase [Allofustis seminis]|uniref:DHH family phosphoesterase n=1 Tax=Allofustis seminis TaxID=166939 RepID=UPI000367B8C1|nr:bifunctional oligoribonuclease/PAP phosphatase NrnA [Allofustis seminis]